MRKTRSQTQAGNASNTRSTASVDANRADRQQQRITPQQIPVNITTSNTDYKEYERMVQMLRVIDLQKILSFLNISFAGRKIDLQIQIKALLHSNFELLSQKIKEVYSLSVAEQMAMYSPMQIPIVQQNLATAGAAPTASAAPTTAQIAPGGSMPGVAVGQHANVLPFLHRIPTQMPIHPDVRLKKLTFYDVLGILIKPSSLVPRNTQRLQEVPFYFTLTPQQAKEIASNRDICNSTKVKHAIQVQLRFCLLQTSCEQEDCFPPNVTVKVNNMICQLPNVIPTNRPNVVPKRPPCPVNITSNVNLSPTMTNTITVQWCPDYTLSYCVAVYLVKKLTSAQLLQRLKTKGVKPADYTRGLIKEKLAEDADCEIATTMLKVSLNCPLGKLKMSLPCRASTCSHLQCFDANLYLQMNERKPTWNCPVCDKPAIYEHLVIDGYFQEVLQSALLTSDATEIQLHKDGSWSTPNLGTSKPIQRIEVISDGIELTTTEKVQPVNSNVLNTMEVPTSTSNSGTVDLTLNDSDDDKRRPPADKQMNTNVSSSTSIGNLNGVAQRNAVVGGGPPQKTEILSLLHKMNEQQLHSIAKVDKLTKETISIRNEVASIKAKVCRELNPPRGHLPKEPYTTLDELGNFEEIIKDKDAMKKFVEELMEIKEKTYDKFIRQCWRHLITDDVAKQCSWRGTDNKICVKGLRTTSGIRNAFKLKFKLKDADFDRTTQKFFQYAQVRVKKSEAKRQKV